MQQVLRRTDIARPSSQRDFDRLRFKIWRSSADLQCHHSFPLNVICYRFPGRWPESQTANGPSISTGPTSNSVHTDRKKRWSDPLDHGPAPTACSKPDARPRVLKMGLASPPSRPQSADSKLQNRPPVGDSVLNFFPIRVWASMRLPHNLFRNSNKCGGPTKFKGASAN